MLPSEVFRLLWTHAWEHGEPQQSKHAAALVHRGDIIAIGRNKNKTHPLQQRYAKNEEAIKLHAELDVIVTALRRHSVELLAECELYVARVKYIELNSRKKIEAWGNSEPCLGCRRAIEAFNIPYVYYTLDGTQLTYESLSEERLTA